MILLACAVDSELRALTKSSAVRTLVTGVGPVEASCAVTAALGRERYRLVINAGLAGSFEDFARIGDGVIVATDSIELRLETGAPLTLPPGDTTVETVSSDPALVAALAGRGFPALRGITVSRVTSTKKTAHRLCAQLGAQVESMEGFAMLRAANLAGVPAVELRGISNRCGPRDSSGWNFEAGIAGLQKITSALFEII